MKTNMTSRERILATIAGEEVDHVPLSLDVHPSYLLYDPKIANWRNQFERTDYLLSLGTDPMIEIWLPDPCYHADVKVDSWREEGVDGTVRLCREYKTPKGSLRQVIRETVDLYLSHKINHNTCGNIADLVDGVELLEDINPSRSIEFLINGPEDLDKMRYLFCLPEGDQLAKWKEDAKYAKQEAEKRQTICLARRIYAGSAILWLTDAQETMCAFVDNPAFIEEFLEIIEQWQLGLLERVLDIGVDIVTRFGYYDTPNFWGIKYFEKYLKPIMEREAEICEDAGVYLSQQQSEGLTQMVDVYKKMKVHILRDVDPVQGNEDLALLKRELGQTKTIMGGINCDLFLTKASLEEIDKIVSDTINLMSVGGRFILHPIPGIYAGVPWEKVLWLVDSWKEHA